LGLSAESELLALAVTHSSYAAEHDCPSNERLEFLGDAVVDLAVADLIVTAYPHLDEGSGSLVRSRVVNEASLANAARRLELGSFVRIGRGEIKSNGLERPSLLADAYEAVVAATTSTPRPGCASGPRRPASACRSTTSPRTVRPTTRPSKRR
jgi:ribonuclease-3